MTLWTFSFIDRDLVRDDLDAIESTLPTTLYSSPEAAQEAAHESADEMWQDSADDGDPESGPVSAPVGPRPEPKWYPDQFTPNAWRWDLDPEGNAYYTVYPMEVANVHSAIDKLREARALRQARADRLVKLYATHGERGPLISGIEQDHFPEADRDWLRANARAIAATIDAAHQLWKQAGRRDHTFRRILDQYRVEGSRY